ncbi:MAG: hypothetical protein IPH88_06575 [Bacteroidales bacterium]|nr:hypothetical protein [Bacteroidales bacterium]
MLRSGIFISLLLVLFAVSCGKEDQPDIPYVLVDNYFYPNTMDYIPVSGYKYVSGGYKGIIIYRISQEEFRIFERCCPHDPEKSNARVIVNSDNIIATDTVCGSSFLLLDGSPTGAGPSSFGLLQYHYSYTNDILYIFN